MIRHYLKIACRNLLKYKTQSIISILGLAIGFTCFALAVLWIRYEMTYDTFHEGFDRIHLVYQKSALSDTGVTTTIPYPVSTSLEKQFPEVEDACGFLFYEQEVTVDDGAIRQLYEINADSCFMHMFGIQVLSGSLDFLESEERIALTEHAAKELFGTENPIGKEIKLYGAPKTVCAIVNGWNRHTNLPFSILTGGIRQWHNAWYHGGFHVFIKLHKEVNAETFQKKLEQTKLEADGKGGIQNLMVMPISKCHYTGRPKCHPVQLYPILLDCRRISYSLFADQLPVFVCQPFTDAKQRIGITQSMRFIRPPSVHPACYRISADLVGRRTYGNGPDRIGIVSVQRIVGSKRRRCLLGIFFILRPRHRMFSCHIPACNFLLQQTNATK